MKTLSMLFLSAVAVSGLFAQSATPPKTPLKVGDAAPDFTLPSTQGKPISLHDFKGKTVVVAFFPAAFTGGCTKEMTSYAASNDKFVAMGATVLAVSTDNTPTLTHWSKELNASYPMLSDFMRKTSAAYGVLMPERGIANRATFVVDGNGKIQHIEEGSGAVDISGAETACQRLKK